MTIGRPASSCRGARPARGRIATDGAGVPGGSRLAVRGSGAEAREAPSARKTNAVRTTISDRIYRRLTVWARSRHALWWLGGVSFAESSVFPIPPDAMLIPMVLADRARAWTIAAVCTVASVLGGLAGYAIGYAFWESLGAPLVAFYGYEEKMSDFVARYREWGAWIVFAAGITPFPYKVITVASGVAALDIVVFAAASLLSRGLRFWGEAALLRWFGAPVQRLVERRFGLFCIIVAASLLVGFLLVGLIGGA